MFDAADTNDSNNLDAGELQGLLVKLWEKMEQPMPLAAFESRMEAMVEETILQFDENRNGKLEFEEFMLALQCNPWNGMLPAHFRAGLPLVARKVVQVAGDGAVAGLPEMTPRTGLASTYDEFKHHPCMETRDKVLAARERLAASGLAPVVDDKAEQMAGFIHTYIY